MSLSSATSRAHVSLHLKSQALVPREVSLAEVERRNRTLERELPELRCSPVDLRFHAHDLVQNAACRLWWRLILVTE